MPEGMRPSTVSRERVSPARPAARATSSTASPIFASSAGSQVAANRPGLTSRSGLRYPAVAVTLTGARRHGRPASSDAKTRNRPVLGSNAEKSRRGGGGERSMRTSFELPSASTTVDHASRTPGGTSTGTWTIPPGPVGCGPKRALPTRTVTLAFGSVSTVIFGSAMSGMQSQSIACPPSVHAVRKATSGWRSFGRVHSASHWSSPTRRGSPIVPLDTASSGSVAARARTVTRAFGSRRTRRGARRSSGPPEAMSSARAEPNDGTARTNDTRSANALMDFTT